MRQMVEPLALQTGTACHRVGYWCYQTHTQLIFHQTPALAPVTRAQAHLLRIRLKERPFRTWRRVAAQLAAESEDKAAAADQQHAAFLLRKALAAFRRCA